MFFWVWFDLWRLPWETVSKPCSLLEVLLLCTINLSSLYDHHTYIKCQMLCSHLVCLPRVCPLCKPGSTRWRNASDVYRGVKCHISLSLSLSPRIGFMCAGSSSALCKCLLELASWNNSFVCGFSFCSLLMYHC